MLRRRTMLTIAIAVLFPAFAAVNVVVGATRAKRLQLSAEWAARGDRDLSAGHPLAAADDYRIAQEYARDRRQYRLQLAQALLAGGRFLEARAQFETLWSESPGDGLVNLELGRVAAHDGDVTDAIRFYHAAIDGAWNEHAADARRRARLELARFLVARGDRMRAQAELIVLSGDPPRDPNALRDVNALRVAAGLDPIDTRRLAFDTRLREFTPPRSRVTR
jgi:tetratricopeptide (TPR) repeat protein